MDVVSAYPKLDVNSAYGKGHRRATLPKWGGKHGSLVRGSVRWNGQGYEVIYSYLLGYSTTAKNTETFLRWTLAIGSYREHDRTVREKQQLELYRSSGKSNPGLAPQTYS